MKKFNEVNFQDAIKVGFKPEIIMSGSSLYLGEFYSSTYRNLNSIPL